MAVYIAFAGGIDYRIKVRCGTPRIGVLGHTKYTASPRAAVVESMDRIVTVLSIDFIILFLPSKSPNSRALS
jgi:hypothetical protein